MTYLLNYKYLKNTNILFLFYLEVVSVDFILVWQGSFPIALRSAYDTYSSIDR